MLNALSLRNFVLIDRMCLETGAGFTSLTGETGAGKSIILDALGVALGGPAERRFIRAGADEASVTAEFQLPPQHPLWGKLADIGVGQGCDEPLTLRRVLRRTGPARAFVNDEPVATALVRRLAADLVEIHGQNAASALASPAKHLHLLDQFAGHEGALAECASAWREFEAARDVASRLKARRAEEDALIEELSGQVEALEALDPQSGEIEALAAERSRLMQAERVREHVGDVVESLADLDVAGLLGRATRCLEHVAGLPGYEDGAAVLARDGFERASIELYEAEHALAGLADMACGDPKALDAAEGRLFALRAAARRHGVDPDALPAVLADARAELESFQSAARELAEAEACEREARARWHGAAERVSQGRTAAARRLERAVKRELPPLKLERARVRVRVEAVPEARFGPSGRDRVEIEVETNPGAGFGPLSKVASGGEMARLSLALTCALAGAGSVGVLIFDEVDHGVGGSVAAAVGERLSRLGGRRQVFAITHSPQVAAAADAQWSVSKSSPRKGGARTRVLGLDRCGRTEEIARMLAGVEVTPEARAAAERLLEDTCHSQTRTRSRSRR
ncbi:MAG: DNA repair protein RecN [Pseudomonadota bacterium]